MFFRREKPRTPAFDELMDQLRKQGFTLQPEPGGGMRVSRGGCAAVVKQTSGGPPSVSRAGVVLGQEIAALVDAGYQKFWLTPSGHRAPATAAHLKALHAFEEDLREGLGLISLYNESLGTTNDLHLYDRVTDRDRGAPKRPWERG